MAWGGVFRRLDFGNGSLGTDHGGLKVDKMVSLTWIYGTADSRNVVLPRHDAREDGSRAWLLQRTQESSFFDFVPALFVYIYQVPGTDTQGCKFGNFRQKSTVITRANDKSLLTHSGVFITRLSSSLSPDCVYCTEVDPDKRIELAHDSLKRIFIRTGKL